MCLDVGVRSSSKESFTGQFNPTHSVAEELYSLLDEVDSEFIVTELEIGKHCEKRDFDNHHKIGIFEGINPSDSLAKLAEKIATHDQLSYMAGSTFSRRTNDRDYRAVVRLLFELLHTPQLYHQRSVQRKRLDRLNRAVVTLDATNLTLTRSVAVAGELNEETVIHEIQPTNGELELNLAARVDGEYSNLLGATVTGGDTREPTQLEHLHSDVEVFADLDSLIRVFDRGYLDYDRVCAMRQRGEDFVTLLQSDV